jgi:hypothetical protein
MMRVCKTPALLNLQPMHGPLEVHSQTELREAAGHWGHQRDSIIRRVVPPLCDIMWGVEA